METPTAWPRAVGRIRNVPGPRSSLPTGWCSPKRGSCLFGSVVPHSECQIPTMNPNTISSALLLTFACVLVASIARAQTATTPTSGKPDRTILPLHEPRYPHSTALDVRKAAPPPLRFEVKAPAGAPNVLIVLLDRRSRPERLPSVISSPMTAGASARGVWAPSMSMGRKWPKDASLAPGRQAGRWMRMDGEGRGVDAEKLASRLRFSAEFTHKVADEIAPGTTVIVTDAPVVRKPVVDSTYFVSN
jgi:hypothetical protein